MTITTSSHGDPRGAPRRGFTLTELMIVMTLSVVLGGALISAFGFVMRGSFAIANYAEMTSDGRRGLEIFARDVRQARDLTAFTDTSLTLLLSPPGAAPYEVIYRYNPNTQFFEREEDGDVRVLMRDVQDDFRFSRFNILQEETDNNPETKQLHLRLSMVKRVIARDTSEKVISARYIMRNKHVAQ